MAAVLPERELDDHETSASAAEAGHRPSGGRLPRFRLAWLREPPLRLRDLVLPPATIAAVALFIAVFDNTALWNGVFRTVQYDPHRLAIITSMAVLVLCPLIAVLALAIGTRALKTMAAALLLTAAVCGFFMTEYGVVIDTSMIRNVMETEAREASPLLTSAFVAHLLSFGVAPAAVLAFLPLGRTPWRLTLAQRGALLTATAAAFAVTLHVNYGALTSFGAAHRELRLLINPLYPLYAAARFVTRADDRPPPQRMQLDARVSAAHAQRAKPTLMVLVVGETARADRFSYNGYERETNPYTRGYGVVSFRDVTSCGTSTADSLPCLFSNLGQSAFAHAAAAKRENLLGVLARLGVNVSWRDNSTGCKHVCEPEQFVEYAARTDERYCDAAGCFDQILLENAGALVEDTSRDQLIVLHQRGSHGPAYHTDTPSWAKAFGPECQSAALQSCTLEAISNAYDNTIVYTDYFLARVIDFLETQQDRYDVAMLYVSDHGESLGEHGLYLHGLPYTLAPREQKQVPMLLWASPDFYASAGVTRQCMAARAGQPLTHDWIFSTVLGVFGVEGSSYDANRDVLAACRHDDGALAAR